MEGRCRKLLGEVMVGKWRPDGCGRVTKVDNYFDGIDQQSKQTLLQMELTKKLADF